MVAGNKVKSLKSDIELSPETKSSRPSRVLPFALKKKKKWTEDFNKSFAKEIMLTAIQNLRMFLSSSRMTN